MLCPQIQYLTPDSINGFNRFSFKPHGGRRKTLCDSVPLEPPNSVALDDILMKSRHAGASNSRGRAHFFEIQNDESQRRD
jgi:hypothetical protein